MMNKSFLLSGKIARKRVGSKYQVMHRNSSRKVKAVRDVGKSPDLMFFIWCTLPMMRLMLLSLGLDVSICSPCVSPARRCTSLRSHIGHTFRRNGFNGSWTKMLNILSSRSVVADRQASGHWAGAAPIRPSFDQTGTQAQLPWEACSWLFLLYVQE